MRRWSVPLAVALGLVALAACAAEEKAAPAPAAKPAEEWQRVLEAAKREGAVAVMGPTGPGARGALTGPFEAKYGIKVEYLGGTGPDLWPRVQTEREGGRYLWDILIAGPTIHHLLFGPPGALDPIEPALILPDVKDPKKWWRGQIDITDKARATLGFSMWSRTAFTINPRMVRADEFKSHKDLLDPKWKGKILMHDPNIPGPGQADFLFFFLHKELGPDFLRALRRQEPVLSRDPRQALEWIAGGRYPILIGVFPAVAQPMKKAGAPIEFVSPAQMKEKGLISSADGNLSLINKAPHPNAARVYINWLLGQEGQTAFARAQGYASQRLDVPTDHLEAWMVPKADYIPVHTEEASQTIVRQLAPLLREIFGR